MSSSPPLTDPARSLKSPDTMTAAESRRSYDVVPAAPRAAAGGVAVDRGDADGVPRRDRVVAAFQCGGLGGTQVAHDDVDIEDVEHLDRVVAADDRRLARDGDIAE